MKRIALIALLAPLYGCPQIEATVDAKNNEVQIAVDFEGRCTGTGMSEDPALGRTTWTKDDSSGSCRATMDWSGDLIDVLQIRDDIDAEANLGDLEVTRLRVLLKSVRVRDAQGRDVTPPDITAFSADTTLGGEPFYSLSGSGLQRALGETGFEQIFEEPHPVLDRLSASLRERRAAPAGAHVEVTTASIAPLQPDNPHTIVFTHDFEITAAGKLKL